MKKITNIFILLTIVIGLTSCGKAFLNEVPPNADPVNDAIKTESDLADAVNGMYNSMRSTNSFGTNIPILGDELADNVYVSSSNSGYFTTEQNYLLLSTNAEAQSIYAQCYYTILQANRIIYAANSLPSSNNVLQLKGEAYTIRAINYLTLVNFFGTPFTTNANALGVPLITSPTNVSGTAIQPARATVGAVYNKIISDLDSAYAIMPAASTTLHSTNSYYVAKYAAKAIESRAYLYKGDYANARDAALLVVQNGGYSLATATGLAAYWANPAGTNAKLETIFELSLNLATNNGTGGVDYFYNTAGYGQNFVYQDLYNQYSTTDARKGLLIVATKGVVLNKYSNTSNTADKDDPKIIRYSEVILNLAEAYARLGDNTNALLYLNQLVQKRDPSFTYTSIGTQLQNDIVAEKRKEFVGEGLRLFDLDRLQLPINRPTQAGVTATLQSIPVADYRRLLPIPQVEVDANTSEVQNPGY
jgi:tetratricopeptide (TPR) repeat protein